MFKSLLKKYLFISKNVNLVSTIERLAWNTGLWTRNGNRFHMASKLSVACFFITNITQLIYLIMQRDDYEKLFESFSVLSFCGMGFFKLSSLYIDKERWCYVLGQITHLEERLLHNFRDPRNVEYDTEDEEDEDCFSPHIIKYTKNHQFMSGLLMKLYGCTAVIFIVTPFIEFALQSSTGYPHILPVWDPLMYFGLLGYLVTILTEAVGAIYCVFIHVVFDCTSIGIMMFICGQFSLLRHYSENIAGRGKNCYLCPKRDKRALFRIRESHYIHVLLVNVIYELNKLLKSVLGVYFFVATLTVCTVAVRLNSQQLSRMQLVSLFQYMCGTLTQLFLFCHYGDAVLNESSIQMGEGPFGTAWWSVSPKVRRSLVLLGCGMSKPRRLRAGPFNSLDLPSFVQIVKTAYSLHAVLGQTSK